MRNGFDPRYFVAIDQSMPENPKVIDLTDAGFRAYVELICYSARVKSDGHIPAGAAARYAIPVLTELADARLLERRQEGAWTIHDYLSHQRSAAEREALSDAKRAGGALGSHGRWHLARRIQDPTCEHCLREASPQVNSSTHSSTHSSPIGSPNGSPNGSDMGT